ncbi:MAG: hypothetical protein AABO58_13575 [Acidobacteriota bacterium]
MHDSLMVYFDGEKYAGLFLAGLGLAVIAAAVLLFRFRSFAITLIVLAVAEIALGVGLYLKTGPQVARLMAQTDYADEAVRMARVQRNFVVIEIVELAIIVICALVAVTQKGRVGVTGVALGLLIHAAILLAFDLLAERRGAVYLNALTENASG